MQIGNGIGYRCALFAAGLVAIMSQPSAGDWIFADQGGTAVSGEELESGSAVFVEDITGVPYIRTFDDDGLTASFHADEDSIGLSHSLELFPWFETHVAIGVRMTLISDAEITIDWDFGSAATGDVWVWDHDNSTLLQNLRPNFADPSAGSTTMLLPAGTYEFGGDTWLNADGSAWFEFTSTCIPAPGALALFGLAGLTARGRRR